jgi:PPM family protein phosphatase
VGDDRDQTWSLPDATVRFRVRAATDRGRVRVVNEDSFVAEPPLFLVADGMGGHAYGDRASQETVRVLTRALAGDEPVHPEAVLSAVQKANAAVQDIGGAAFAGTTLAGLALARDHSGRLYWMAFNVGDSRIYRWDGDQLAQLSVDHSAVQELVEDGLITLLEAEHHPDRNVVTRALGAVSDPDPDVWLLPASGRQCYLLCSDGLTKELDNVRIAAVLRESPGDAAVRLIDAALAAGGADNITVVFVEATTSNGKRQPDPSDITPRRTLPEHLEKTHPRT